MILENASKSMGILDFMKRFVKITTILLVVVATLTKCTGFKWYETFAALLIS